MNIEILQEKENPLLERKEIRFRISYAESTTPPMGQIRAEVIKKLKSDGELTIVDSVIPEFGAASAKGYVKVYSKKEGLVVEPEHKKKKNFESVEKPKEAAADAKAAEAPKVEEKAADVTKEKKAKEPADTKESKPAKEKKVESKGDAK